MLHKIAVIGAGHLGSALVRGLILSGYSKDSIICSNRNQHKLQKLKDSLNIETSSSNLSAVANADTVVLAVKPQVLTQVCQEISPIIQQKQPLIISLAGVIHTDAMATALQAERASIIRVMTNTPIEFCMGSSALFANAFTTTLQKEWCHQLFQAVGDVSWVNDEHMLNVLTAAIGCSPAYVFLFLEALEKAAISRGIAPEEAAKIALQTVRGSVALAEHSGKSFAELRDNVTTPAGVTDYSLKKISKPDFFKNFEAIYQAAEERIDELDKATLAQS